MDWYFGHVWLVRLLVQRSLAVLYLIGFAVVLQQFKPLLGQRGLLPVPDFLKRATFREAPSIFFWRYSDGFLQVVAWTGLVLAVAAALGLPQRGPVWLSLTVWLA